MTASTVLSTLVLAHHDGYPHHGWFPFFPLIPLFFIGLWVVLALTIGRRWRQAQRWSRPGASVLADRYARGEIDEAEYRERLAVLRDGPGGTPRR